MEKLTECLMLLSYFFIVTSVAYGPLWLKEQIKANPYRLVFFGSIGVLVWALGMACFVSAWYLLFIPLACGGLFTVFMAGAKG